MLLAPGDYLPALVDIRYQHFVLKRLVCVRGGVVCLEPVLDILSVISVPVGCNHRVFHKRALERHVTQLIWNTPYEDRTRWKSMQIEKDGPEALTGRFRDVGCSAGAAGHLILNSGRELAIRKSVNLIKLVRVVCGFQGQ